MSLGGRLGFLVTMGGRGDWLGVCQSPDHHQQYRAQILNFKGAQELIPKSQYDNPIPTRFLAPIDCLKIPALLT